MNILLHVLVNYDLALVVFGAGRVDLLIVVFFSAIVDVDHLPYVLRNGLGVVRKRFGAYSRSRLHELWGVAFFSVLLCVLAIYDLYVAEVGALCVVLHYALDFLTGDTRPFYPYSGAVVNMDIFTRRYRVLVELLLTFFMGVVTWLAMAG